MMCPKCETEMNKQDSGGIALVPLANEIHGPSLARSSFGSRITLSQEKSSAGSACGNWCATPSCRFELLTKGTIRPEPPGIEIEAPGHPELASSNSSRTITFCDGSISIWLTSAVTTRCAAGNGASRQLFRLVKAKHPRRGAFPKAQSLRNADSQGYRGGRHGNVTSGDGWYRTHVHPCPCVLDCPARTRRSDKPGIGALANVQVAPSIG